MRILIAGGHGFVGGRLAEFLNKIGHQIILGSRSQRPIPDWLPQADQRILDWDDSRALDKCCSGVDVVIQASGMNAPDCALDPVNALIVNGVWTSRLLDSACNSGVGTFIYLSTAHVYGSPLTGTVTEKNCPVNLHPYASSHMAGENAVLYQNQIHRIKGTVVRLANSFGAPMSLDTNCWMLLVNDLCKQAIQNKKLILKTMGYQKRDFVGLTQVGRQISKVIDGSILLNSKKGIFNLGSGVSIAVRDIASMIQSRCFMLFGYRPEIVFNAEDGAQDPSDFRYISESIKAENIDVIQLQIEEEIDLLLMYCKTIFRS
jgi:UDP-glucose 4-epimerase